MFFYYNSNEQTIIKQKLDELRFRTYGAGVSFSKCKVVQELKITNPVRKNYIDRDEHRQFTVYVVSFIVENGFRFSRDTGNNVRHLCHRNFCFEPSHLKMESTLGNNRRKTWKKVLLLMEKQRRRQRNIRFTPTTLTCLDICECKPFCFYNIGQII